MLKALSGALVVVAVLVSGFGVSNAAESMRNAGETSMGLERLAARDEVSARSEFFTGEVVEFPPNSEGYPFGAFLILDKSVTFEGSTVRLVQLPGIYSSNVGQWLRVEGELTRRTSPSGTEYFVFAGFVDRTEARESFRGSIMRFPDVGGGEPSGAFLVLDAPVMVNGEQHRLVQLAPPFASVTGTLQVSGILEARTSGNGTGFLALRDIKLERASTP